MFYNKEILEEEFVVTKNRVNRIHRKILQSIVSFKYKVNLKVQPSTELQRTT